MPYPPYEDHGKFQWGGGSQPPKWNKMKHNKNSKVGGRVWVLGTGMYQYISRSHCFIEFKIFKIWFLYHRKNDYDWCYFIGNKTIVWGIGCYFCRHSDGTLSNLSERENTVQHRAYRIPFSFLRPYTTNYIKYGEY